MKKKERTNVMRILDQNAVEYESYCYLNTGAVSGVEVAAALGFDPASVFKTLVTVGRSKDHYVFMIPVAEELDLKKAAKAVGEKSVAMIPQKELLPLTGYIHGGCSPIGMKKMFVTRLDESAGRFETIVFSAGKVGYQVRLKPEELKKLVKAEMADLTVSTKN